MNADFCNAFRFCLLNHSLKMIHVAVDIAVGK